MREVEPFGYFINHASAIAGLGGGEPSPAPDYFFHSGYEPVRTGRAAFHLTLTGARATRGELTLRVHAHKPGTGSDIELAGGARCLLTDIRDGKLTIVARFSAAPDVQYALYGHFTEPTDLDVDTIVVRLEETERPQRTQVKGRSTFGNKIDAYFSKDIARLCSDTSPSLLTPTSQFCTQSQLLDPDFYSFWPEVPNSKSDPVLRWKQIIPLQILARAGLLQKGASGLLVNPPGPATAQSISAWGCAIETDPAPTSFEAAETPGYDFAIEYTDLEALLSVDPASEGLALQVLQGGLMIFVLDCAAADESAQIRNQIRTLALRMIGKGPNVAQLRLGSDGRISTISPTLPAFVLVASR